MAEDKIDVKFGAQTSELDAGTDHVQEKLGELKGAGESLTSMFATIGGVIAGAFAVDKIAEFINQTGDLAEQINRLVIVTGDSASTIQAFQFAMKMTGGDAESAGMALVKFERSAYEAAAGTGSAYDAMKRLGISLSDLKYASSEDLFNQMLNGLAGIADQSERNAMGIQLLGRGYLNVAAAVDGGTAGLEQYRAKMQETGTLMNSARIEAFGGLEEATKLMSASFRGLGETIQITFIKTLTTAVEWVAALVRQIELMIRDLAIAEEKFQAFLGLQSKEEAQKNINLYMNTPDKKKEGARVDGAGRNADAAAAEEQKAADKKAQIEERLYGQISQIQEAEYQQFVANEQLKVARKQETAQDAIRAEMRMLPAERDLVLTNMTNSMNLYKKDSDNYKEAQAKKELVAIQFNTKMTQLQTKKQLEDNKQADKYAITWEKALHTVENAMDSMVEGVFRGTQTIGEAFARLAGNLIIAMVEAFIKIGLEWAAVQLGMIPSTKATALAAISASAGEAFAAAYAAICAIPIIGPGLAPGVAAASGAEAMVGGVALAALELGTPRVPKTGLAILHEDEAVIPANTARKWRDGDLGVGAGGGESHIHWHVNAMDSRDVKRFLAKNGAALGRQMQSYLRNGGRSALATT